MRPAQFAKIAKKSLQEKWKVDDFMDLFTFYVPGFNVRPTDLQAFIGLERLSRLDYIAQCRFENFKVYRDIIERAGMWVPKYPSKTHITGYLMPQTIAPWQDATKLMQKKNPSSSSMRGPACAVWARRSPVAGLKLS